MAFEPRPGTFARVGTKVTTLMNHDRAPSHFDGDFIESVLRFAEGLGVEFWKTPRSGPPPAPGMAFAWDSQRAGRSTSMEADFVLNAAGASRPSSPSTRRARRRCVTEKGVTVDEYLRVRTIGASSPEEMPTASAEPRRSPPYEGRVIGRNFLKENAERVDYSRIPSAVFTVPPLAWVGMTEQEAAARRPAGRGGVQRYETAWKVYAMARGA